MIITLKYVLPSHELISSMKKIVIPMKKMKTQSHHKIILKNTLLLNETVNKVLRRMKVQIMIGLSKMKHLHAFL